MLSDVRKITERNAQGVASTLRETTGLLDQAEELAAVVGRFNGGETDAAAPTDGEKSRGRRKKVAPAKDGGSNGAAQNE